MDDDALDARIDRLVAIEEIKQLKARYFRLMDLKLWDDWGKVFAAGCTMEVPEADMSVTGRDEIVRTVSTALTGSTTTHHGHMPEIEITGEGTAKGIWAMFDYVQWPKDDETTWGLQGYGHYIEQYVVEDGGWRIARTKLERLRVDTLA